MECDEVCAHKVEQSRSAAEEMERKQREAEEEKNRLELLEFERKMGKKKSKERKQVAVKEKRGMGWMVYAGVAMVVVAVLVAGAFSMNWL